MTPEKLFHELSGLGLNWRVTECEFDRESGVVRLRIEETEHVWKVERSPDKGAEVACHDHTEEMVWRHLNVFEHKCEIRCRLPRVRCIKTQKVYRVCPPWERLSIYFAKVFEAMALLLMREMPVVAVARHLKETDTRLWRMLKRHVEAAYPLANWSNVICVGCDAMSVRKGHNYVSVFCALLGKRVLSAVKGRAKRVWESFAQAHEAQTAQYLVIRELLMNMSPSYIAEAQENIGSQAVMVFDKFHVIAHVNDAKNALKGSRWIWLKNPENLMDKQRTKQQGIKAVNLTTATAYQMRFTLQDIYDVANSRVAKRKLQAWRRWVRRVAKKHASLLLHQMVKCAGMIGSHLEGILAHWRNKTTNAFHEALNSVFLAVKRRARGFRSTDNLIAMLYFTAGKLRIPATH